MKSIKQKIDSHINDCIVESYNIATEMFLREKIKLINSLRKTRRFGHFLNQGFIETVKQYFDKFYFKF